MNKFLKGAKTALGVVLAVAMTLPASIASMVSAATNLTIQNPEAITLSDGVVLSKTAEAVAGEVNTWDVTLRVESPKTKTTSDTVIVIDTSASMKSDGKMTEAKKAAKSLAEQLLPAGNTSNRVALVSFNEYVYISNFSGSTFSNSYEAVASKIDGLSPTKGTFTQAAIRRAANLLKDSTANIKNIVFLSDGEPTYGYRINNPDNYLINGGPGWGPREKQTSVNVPQSAFLYDMPKVGAGNSMYYAYERAIAYDSYYNLGNSAIAEAGFYKSGNNGDLYTIALSANEAGKNVLKNMATPGKAYTATVENLTSIFNQIAGKITSTIQSAQVNDIMGEGVTISSESGFGVAGADNLNWKPDFKYNTATGKYVAEITYRVKANDDILNNLNSDGYAPLNEKATITYNGIKTANFPVPMVKPYSISLTKELVGQTCAGCKFDIELTFPNKTKHTYSLAAGETKAIVSDLTEGKYSVRETGTHNNSVPFLNYLVDYSQKTFTISASRKPINITITNTYETIDLVAIKHWDDNEDQDGLRKDYKLYLSVKNGNNYVTYQQLSNITDEELHFTLPKYFNGTEIEYSIEESTNCDDLKNVICTPFNGDSKYLVQVNGTRVVNIHAPETVNIKVKKNWDDENNRDGLRIDTTRVKFCVNGVERICKDASGLLDEAEIEFEGLPKYNNGQLINYTVEEVDILNGYEVTNLPEGAIEIIDNKAEVSATNVHTPEKINIVVTTEWNDKSNVDGIRPDEYTAILKANGSDISTKIVEKDDSVEEICDTWCVEYEDLYKNENGEEISYTIEPSVVEGYTVEVAGNAEDGFKVIYTHTPKPVVIDPCLLNECGKGAVEIVKAPETGKFTQSPATNGENSSHMNLAMAILSVSVIVLASGIAIFSKRK